ncbi:MAG: hypothetical protein E4H15_00085 [Syntrophobacterales bacterium]|nr:MAG: hypothetical protein E4H15_00085 [Syntrophobacterales bacterium]
MEEKKFSRFPKKVKNGIFFLFSAWIFFIISQAVLSGTVSLLHTTLGMLCCVMVYSIRNGGRIACIIYNIALIAAGLYNLYVLTGSGMLYSAPSAVNLINIILFSIATYYLLSGETASFYKSGKESLPKGAD